MLCITNDSIKHQSFIFTQLNVKTVLFQAIHFTISTHFSSIGPTDRNLSGTTTPSHNGPGSDGNEGILCIPQNLRITEASPSDCLMSYPGHTLGESYPSAEMQSMYLFCSPSRLGWLNKETKPKLSLVLTQCKKYGVTQWDSSNLIPKPLHYPRYLTPFRFCLCVYPFVSTSSTVLQ